MSIVTNVPSRIDQTAIAPRSEEARECRKPVTSSYWCLSKDGLRHIDRMRLGVKWRESVMSFAS